MKLVLLSLLFCIAIPLAYAGTTCRSITNQTLCEKSSDVNCAWCGGQYGFCFDKTVDNCCTVNPYGPAMVCNMTTTCCQSYHPTGGGSCCSETEKCCGYYETTCCPEGTTCCVAQTTTWAGCCKPNQKCVYSNQCVDIDAEELS
eukprot:TRINITY_DN9984_c0_g1_i1.p1 TRINITY_DN9984_c0_g1~~TRINITY_DN9984_c0_g1_i1.p1  ORF type:complete len:144 (-),score=12.47 TRINITY_DN9984_c0_g1_i1:12-443(-)